MDGLVEFRNAVIGIHILDKTSLAIVFLELENEEIVIMFLRTHENAINVVNQDEIESFMQFCFIEQLFTVTIIEEENWLRKINMIISFASEVKEGFHRFLNEPTQIILEWNLTLIGHFHGQVNLVQNFVSPFALFEGKHEDESIGKQRKIGLIIVEIDILHYEEGHQQSVQSAIDQWHELLVFFIKERQYAIDLFLFV